MYLLHIETSTSICSVAVSKNDKLLAVVDLPEGMNHTAQLTPSIQSILKSCSLIPGDLGAITVSSGPGSYTGLRVGSSTAKAMSYALKIPIIPVPTLEALAMAANIVHPSADALLPMLDARRNEVFMALYNGSMDMLIPPSSLILDQEAVLDLLSGYKAIIACGDGSWKLKTHNYPYLTIDQSIQSSAAHLVRPAWAYFEKGVTGDPMHFVPEYLKPPNITEPRKTA
ncbi:MAG: tRNA (adenosine(37)-N6)-threonylcarbamoyltransferase complex dimerization subunit type 1 TsaB [Bacteroidota bacterium]|nr:tRNA (adenosine(37)-N6)-threonylcarbamoyltransferase complex dimerization subunit type 1 TsaB [Bacteroidota bacterium]